MKQNKIMLGGLAVLLLACYNSAQPGLSNMRTMNSLMPTNASEAEIKKIKNVIRTQRYGPSLEWLNRVMGANTMTIGGTNYGAPKLDFRMLSSLMLAGLASGFKSQVANLLWMKSDEYWHKGMLTRQNPIMEAVVTLDPQFLEAWDTAGWHWSYNIYADLPNRPDVVIKDTHSDKEKLRRMRELRKAQDVAVKTGLDYYARGTQMNPDKYLLWFKFGWTKAEKFGILDEETVNLFRTARLQPDARLQESQEYDPKDGKMVTKQKTGLDLMGRTVGHAYEAMPDVDKALESYADDLLELKNKPAMRKLLMDNGHFWAKYSSLYHMIGQEYQKADAVGKAQIKKLAPDVDQLIAALNVRNETATFHKGEGSQPTGAIVSIVARYKKAWDLWQAGKPEEAAAFMTEIMNCNQKFHLQKLDVLGKVMEIRGDAPAAIKGELEAQISYEKASSQDIGLHLLGRIFEAQMQAAKDKDHKTAYALMAYECWVRGRQRNTLDFYARRKSLILEDEFNFAEPPEIAKQVGDSRKKGEVIASDATVPTIAEYLKKIKQPKTFAALPSETSPTATVGSPGAPALPAEAPGHSAHDGHNH